MRFRRSRWTHHTVVFAAVLLLATDVFGGLLRYYLSALGISSLVYAPKLIAVALIGYLTMTQIASGRIGRSHVAVLAVLFVFSLVAALQLKDAARVLFGLWVLVPLMFGVVAYPYFTESLTRLRGAFFFLWAAAVAGMILNSLNALPWIGFQYQLGDFTLEAGRRWSTFGVQRLAGFSQASYAAAHQILLLGLIVIATYRGWLLRLTVLTVSGIGIYLTTIKADIATLGFIALFLLFRPVIPRVAWGLLPAVIATAVIAVPLSSLLMEPSWELRNPVLASLFASFEIRLQDTWPDAFAIVGQEGNLLLGIGIGGLGTPQDVFGTGPYSPGDNMFVYLYGLTGILAVWIVAWLGYGSYGLEVRRSVRDLFFFASVVSILLLGVTSNVVESTFLSFILGLSIRHLAARRVAAPRRRRPRGAIARLLPGTS